MSYYGNYPTQTHGSANPQTARHINSPPVTAGTSSYAQMSFGGGNPNAGGAQVGGGIIPSWGQPSPRGTDPGIVGQGPFNAPAERYYGTQRMSDSKADGSNGGSSGAGGNLPAEIGPNGEIISQTMGLRSNERVHYQVHVSKACLPYSHMLARQMYLVLRVGSGGGIPSGGMSLSPQERAAEDTWPTVLPVPAVNYLSACSALVGQPDMTAREFLATWAALGSCVSEEGTDTRNDLRPGMVVGLSRRGPEQLKNVWGANLEADTPLYYIVRMEWIPDYYQLDPNGESADVPADYNDMPLKKRALQLIPYASLTHPEPTLADLAYIDNDGNHCFGAAIRIGRVETRTMAPNAGAVSTSWFSLPSMIACLDINVFLDQPRIFTVSC